MNGYLLFFVCLYVCMFVSTLSIRLYSVKRGLKLLFGATVFLCPAVPAYSMDAEMAKKFEQLMAVVEAQNKKIESLEKKLKDVEGQKAPPKQSVSESQALDKVLELESRMEKQQVLIEKQAETIETVKSSTFQGDGLKIKQKDGTPYFDFGNGTTFNIHGRIQTDFALFSEDDGVDLPNQADIRRLRLGAKGTFAHDWAWAFFTDTNGGTPVVGDAWLAYNGFDKISLKLGSQIEILTLEQHVSNLNQSLVERSIVHEAFYPGRSIGFTGLYSGNNWNVALGVFGDDVNDGNETDETEHAYGARATFAPINEGTHVWHMGAAYRYAEPNAGDETARFRARPGTRQSDAIRTTDTGGISNVDNYDLLGLEFAYTYDKYALQGEYIFASVDRQGSLSGLDFDGWYVQGAWFLTGEQRPYRSANGSFGGVKVNNPLGSGGWGALELASRFAALDLNDDDINGGEQETINFGANWYPNDNVKFELNYIINNVDGGPLDGQDIDVVQLRAQVDF